MVLHLDDDLRATLRTLLTVADRMPVDARVVDYLAPNPWGDLAAFSAAVYDPLLRLEVGPRLGGSTTPVMIASADATVAVHVLTALAESFSTGVPWSPLSADERCAIPRLLGTL